MSAAASAPGWAPPWQESLLALSSGPRVRTASPLGINKVALLQSRLTSHLGAGTGGGGAKEPGCVVSIVTQVPGAGHSEGHLEGQ